MEAWPEVTDVDRVMAAFDRLRNQNIAAFANMGADQASGQAECVAVAARDGQEGFCFFHQQDMFRAIEHGKLYLGFGPTDAADEQTEGVRIGRIICDALRAEGLAVTWDGTFEQRPLVEPITWQFRG